jgi:hypothetical protein
VIAREVQRAGAGIRSLAEPFLDTTSDFAEIVFAILGVAAKLERRRIKERTAIGRADAKAKGVKFGRKPILTAHQQHEARRRLAAGETQRSIARSYNVSQARALMRTYKRNGYAHQHLSIEAGRLMNASARMMDTYQRGLLTLERIRSGGRQTVVVQHVNVADGGQAMIAGQVKARAKRRGRRAKNGGD